MPVPPREFSGDPQNQSSSLPQPHHHHHTDCQVTALSFLGHRKVEPAAFSLLALASGVIAVESLSAHFPGGEETQQAEGHLALRNECVAKAWHGVSQMSFSLLLH